MTETQVFEDLEQILQQSLAALEEVKDEAGLQAWRTAHLGRSAPVMQMFSRLPQLPGAAPAGGAAGQSGQAGAGGRTGRTRRTGPGGQPAAEAGFGAGGRHPAGPAALRGRLHPETQVLRRIFAVFEEMGFQVFRSRDVETDEYNFELLNIPAYHPARDMWDTFYTTRPGVLLRTHTSPGQIHVMRASAPEPIRAILPGMCYRYEQVSARHETQFYQVEVLAVGKNITFGDLKGTVNGFARRMFGQNVRTRLRPSYFPFTEPSAEMDVECFVCGGKGCPVCKGSGWLEIMGCGMMHPTVLRNGGYDPEFYSGFAAGMGPERISMLQSRIEDIRYFWANDLRFLEQF